MRRSRTYPATPPRQQPDDDEEEAFLFAAPGNSPMEEPAGLQLLSSNTNAALVHNIASFLTLSDAASFCTSPADSWAVGLELHEDQQQHDATTSNDASCWASLSQIETLLRYNWDRCFTRYFN